MGYLKKKKRLVVDERVRVKLSEKETLNIKLVISRYKSPKVGRRALKPEGVTCAKVLW